MTTTTDQTTPKPGFSDLSDHDLRDAQERIASEIETRERELIAKQLRQLREYAESQGFLVDKIFTRENVQVLPKYAHPTDPELTWSGRGRRPLWLNELLSQGKTLDDLSIT